MARVKIATANMPDVDTHRRQLASELNQLRQSGSFIATLTGMSSSTTGEVIYRKVGSFVRLRIPISILGTSNANNMRMTGLPPPVQSNILNRVYSALLDNTVDQIPGEAWIQDDGITFLTGNPLSSTGFTATGTKGLEFGWTVSYFVDDE